MNAILQEDGTLLVTVGACAAAETITPDHPRYAEFLAESVVAAELRGIPEEDAALAVRWERTYKDHQPRSA